MAERFDRHDNGGGTFVMGLLAGTALGVGLGMLFAPKAGAELREQLSEQAGTLAEQAQDGYRYAADQASGWVESSKKAGSEMVERSEEQLLRGVEKAQVQAERASRRS